MSEYPLIPFTSVKPQRASRPFDYYSVASDVIFIPLKHKTQEF